uniref:Uncharacterized protein n=1 Tax=Cercocebus atys TaxID=9531 RepID=A0A2K5M9R3_CERAT
GWEKSHEESSDQSLQTPTPQLESQEPHSPHSNRKHQLLVPKKGGPQLQELRPGKDRASGTRKSLRAPGNVAASVAELEGPSNAIHRNSPGTQGRQKGWLV